MVTGNVSATYGPLIMPSMPGSVSLTPPDWATVAATSAGVGPGFGGGTAPEPPVGGAATSGGVVPGAGGGAASSAISVASGASATISEPDVTTTLYRRTRIWTGSNHDCPVRTSNSQPCQGQRTI